MVLGGTWSPTGSLSTARVLHTANLLQNGKVLVAGGVGSGGVLLSSAELFTPPDAAAQISDLINTVNGFQLVPTGIQTSLDAKLQDALTALGAGDTATACSDLTDFISQVKAQSGKMLTTSQATQLIAAAQRIQAVLAC